MRKRIIALFLAGCMILSLASCKGKDPAEETRPDSTAGQAGEAVTRGQWITMLADAFGLNTYESAEPHYTDIQAGNPLFAAVQSAAEWGILDALSGERFDADKNITRDEVAATAALTAGFEQSDGETAVKYAVRHGIIPDGKPLTDSVGQAECKNAVDAAVFAYLNTPDEEEFSVKWNKEHSYFDLSSDFFSSATVTDSAVIFPAEVLVRTNADNSFALNVGGEEVPIGVNDILLAAPDALHPCGRSYKVSEIMHDSNTVTLEISTPKLGDLYDELVVHTVSPVDLSNIIWADGVSAIPTEPETTSSMRGAKSQINRLDVTYIEPDVLWRDENEVALTSGGFIIDLLVGDCSKTQGNGNSRVLGNDRGAQILNDSNFVYDKTPSVEDFKDSKTPWTEELKSENKFSAGYSISGKLTINSITVRTDVEYSKFLGFADYPQKASIQIKSDISSALEFKGNLSERVPIGQIPITIPATGLVVLLELYLNLDTSGALRVEATFQNEAKAEWQAKSNLKRPKPQSSVDVKTEAAIEIGFGAELAASLVALGKINIMDVGVKAGGELAADAYVDGKCEVKEADDTTTMTYTESMHVTTNLYAPIASLYIGSEDSLIAKAGISDTWDIIGKSAANTYPLIDEEWVFWNETVTLDKNGNVINTETTTAGEPEMSGDDIFAQLQSGDFSAFAGTYQYVSGAYYGSENEIVLNADGSVSGLFGFNKAPVSVEKNADGAICCTIDRWDKAGGPDSSPFSYNGNFYILCPVGVSSAYEGQPGYDEIVGTDSIRIRIVSIDGGISDVMFAKT